VKPASPEALALATLAGALIDLALAAMIVVAGINAWAPPQDLAWKPLSIDHPVGLATGAKVARARSDASQCRAVLREGRVGYADEPGRSSGFCSTRGALRLTAGVTRLRPASPVMTCSEALAYAIWDRQVLRPAAEQLGEAVASVDHYGTYACRNVYGEAGGRPSEHATANALDVAGFTLVDGRRVRVLDDFRREDARGRFLRRVRDGACGLFRAVLSPDYNAAHRDHLHLDMGRYGVCA
jgi:hypothetical protein